MSAKTHIHATDLVLRCLAMKRRNYWVAMCVDLDLTVQADTLPQARKLLKGQISSYVAEATMPNRTTGDSRVYQLVSSPIRNTLDRRKRRVMRFAISPAGRAIGRGLHRSAGSDKVAATWKLTHGPEFANELGALTIDGESLELMLERARPDDHGEPILEEVIRTAL